MNDHIPLFPLTQGVFPEGLLALQIFEVRYLDLIKRCHQQQTPFGVAWLKKGREVQVPGEMPLLHPYGCLAHIRQFEQLQPNLFRIICQGGMRFELHETHAGPYGVWQGRVTYLPNDPEVPIPEPLQHHANRLGKLIASAQQQGQSHRLPIMPPYALDQCGWVANRYAEALDIGADQKMQLLSENDPLTRLQTIDALMAER